jgi:hypothetical protein
MSGMRPAKHSRTGAHRRAVPWHSPGRVSLPVPTTRRRHAPRAARLGRAGIGLTESYATTPGASVSGLYFGHPQARYFSVGRVGRDQVADYAERKGIALSEAERWLRQNLAYEP